MKQWEFIICKPILNDYTIAIQDSFQNPVKDERAEDGVAVSNFGPGLNLGDNIRLDIYHHPSSIPKRLTGAWERLQHSSIIPAASLSDRASSTFHTSILVLRFLYLHVDQRWQREPWPTIYFIKKLNQNRSFHHYRFLCNGLRRLYLVWFSGGGIAQLSTNAGKQRTLQKRNCSVAIVLCGTDNADLLETTPRVSRKLPR